MESLWDQVLPALQSIYQVSSVDALPSPRIKAEWVPENKIGFFKGLCHYGRAEHIDKLIELLRSFGSLFPKEKCPLVIKGQSLSGGAAELLDDVSSEAGALLQVDSLTRADKGSAESLSLEDILDKYIDEMLAFYIFPFRQNSRNRCQTPDTASMESCSTESVNHYALKKTLEVRDVWCLFCWDSLYLRATHILSQKLSSFNTHETLTSMAGISEMHHLQNGLLLCVKCHLCFDDLTFYVDSTDEQNRMLFKAVNPTDDDTYTPWQLRTRSVQYSRLANQPDFTDGRVPTDEDGEMRLWFANTEENTLPSKLALDLHKRACLIWRMAGGADPDDADSCDLDDDYSPAAPQDDLKDRIITWNSTVTDDLE